MPACNADGCDREATRTRSTWCEKHYYRIRRNGSPTLPARESRRAPRPPCGVEGCGRDSRLVGGAMCEMHERRLARTGSVEGRGRASGACIAAECDTPANATDGYCGKHRERVRRHGDPDLVLENPRWTGDQASYMAMHQRLRATQGPASKRRCADCGGPARHWSYNRTAGPRERASEVGPYSLDPDDYVPRCVPCHTRFDRGAARPYTTTAGSPRRARQEKI